jgi:hypothetical protein
MTAVPYGDVVATQPAPKPASKRSPIDWGDPMVDATVRLLSIPLRQLYAALWRLGLIEVR